MREAAAIQAAQKRPTGGASAIGLLPIMRKSIDPATTARHGRGGCVLWLAELLSRAKTLPGDWGIDQAAREGSAAVSSKQKRPRIVSLPFATFGELFAF